MAFVGEPVIVVGSVSLFLMFEITFEETLVAESPQHRHDTKQGAGMCR
jgi:hypothetical protein